MKVELLVKTFGSWELGYGWCGVSLGGSRPVKGLALYAKKEGNLADRYICFTLKEAMCFFERNKVPPKHAAKLLHAAEKIGGAL